ncbi:hypothetical protein [Kineococcus xinjiangensis]|uniref:hypothetical protein n=1 Tax=Kineococcus xinjiangensis TaxID=512762 RepID=UPI0011B0B32F|nr:hypothetical protein [Kineococcus xinjiangensis]
MSERGLSGRGRVPAAGWTCLGWIVVAALLVSIAASHALLWAEVGLPDTRSLWIGTVERLLHSAVVLGCAAVLFDGGSGWRAPRRAALVGVAALVGAAAAAVRQGARTPVEDGDFLDWGDLPESLAVAALAWSALTGVAVLLRRRTRAAVGRQVPEEGRAFSLPRAVAVPWWIVTVVAALGPVVHAWALVNIHFFGDTADRDDHLVGGAGLVVGVAVMLAAAVGAAGLGGSRALRRFACAAAVVHAVLAAHYLTGASGVPPAENPLSPLWWPGVLIPSGPVHLALLISAGAAAVRLLRARRGVPVP